MTKRFTIAALLCGALALPAGAAAQSEPTPENYKNAAKYCKALRAAAGDANFKAMFGGGKNAYGKCVSQQKKAEEADAAEDNKNELSAAKQCKAEQKQSDEEFSGAHGGKTFAQQYGTNKNGKNAFGKCVSSKAKAMNAEDEQEQEQEAPEQS